MAQVGTVQENAEATIKWDMLIQTDRKRQETWPEKNLYKACENYLVNRDMRLECQKW